MKTIAAFVFPGFETLDYFGPIEMLGGFAGQSKIITVAQTLDPVASVHGQRIVPDATLDQKDDYDLILIPGGDAALNLLQDQPLLDWINRASTNAEKVMAVCTGTILLGASGVLDGRRATTNKMDFTATVPLVPNVTTASSTHPLAFRQAWIWRWQSWLIYTATTPPPSWQSVANTNGTKTPTVTHLQSWQASSDPPFPTPQNPAIPQPVLGHSVPSRLGGPLWAIKSSSLAPQAMWAAKC